MEMKIISTHAPAGGATRSYGQETEEIELFLLTPLREGRLAARAFSMSSVMLFLLTPLREGRRKHSERLRRGRTHFYSRPCGRGDWCGRLSR